MAKRFFPQPTDPPALEDGKFYDLVPPSNVNGDIFDRIQCEYRHPGCPNEYVVRGRPRGGGKVQSFVLRFTANGKTKPQLSEDQANDLI